MAELAESDQVDDHIILEFLPVLGGDPEDTHDVLHALSVDVEDRGVDRLSDVRAVVTGSLPVWGGGEAHLVVDDHMHGAPHSVVGELGHLEALEDDALARHGGVTVHDDWHDLAARCLVASAVVLLGPGSAANDRVDSFQVGWVGEQGHPDVDLICPVLALEGGAQMVFDVPSGQLLCLLDLWSDPLELSHNDFHWLPHDVGEGV